MFKVKGNLPELRSPDAQNAIKIVTVITLGYAPVSTRKFSFWTAPSDPSTTTKYPQVLVNREFDWDVDKQLRFRHCRMGRKNGRLTPTESEV
jgi:hypothetical protein